MNEADGTASIGFVIAQMEDKQSDGRIKSNHECSGRREEGSWLNLC